MSSPPGKWSDQTDRTERTERKERKERTGNTLSTDRAVTIKMSGSRVFPRILDN
jgi:hypothetical protein